MRTFECDTGIIEAIAETARSRPEQSFYLLHEARLRAKARLLVDLFLPGYEQGRVAYAVKANPTPRILDILLEEGITAFDCASLREIELVRQLDVAAEIFFNNPIKKRGDIRRAHRLGVRHYTVQSTSEFAKLRDCVGDAPTEVAVRLAVANPHAVIDLSEKFGAPPARFRSLLAEVAAHAPAAAGLSFHVGSQCRDLRAFADAARLAGELADGVSVPLAFANVGGGLPVNYAPDDRYRIEDYFAAINRAVADHLLPRLRDGGKVIVEPGRALVADSVYLAVPVLGVEGRARRRVYIDDGIWTSFINVALFRWPFRFDVVGRDLRPLREETAPAVLYGRTCDSTDRIGEVGLPEDLAEGDLIVFHDFGAYRGALATSFNGFEPPRYVSLP